MAGLLTRQRVLLAEIETTSGTIESPAAADGVFNVMSDGPIITADIPMIERPGQSSFDRLPGVPGARAGRASFSLHIVGNGSAGIPSWASVFLPPCGMVATSQSYSFVTGSTSAKTLTLGEAIDGRMHYLYGAVGNWTMNFRSGEIATIDFEFQGIYGTDADVALPTPDYPAILPPRWANASGATFGSYSPLLSTATVSSGNVLKLREDANATSGYKCGIITDRVPTWSIDPELELVATKDWMAAYLASTQASLAFVLGTVSNNIITVTMPKAQITAAPQPADRDGVAVHSISGIATRNADAGDDCMTVVFS
jgi:hypothetical protein